MKSFPKLGRRHDRHWRGAEEMPRRRRQTFAHVLWLLLLLAQGCGPASSDFAEYRVALRLDREPPVVGLSAVTVELADAAGAPLQGAAVRVEGNMNHAGMKPSFGDLQEADAGRYTGTIDFTMGGDWYILVTATLADGSVFERKIDVPGVKAP